MPAWDGRRLCGRCGKRKPLNTDHFDRIDGRYSSECILCQKGIRMCNSCGEAFPLNTNHFYKQPRNKDGYHHECIGCMNARKTRGLEANQRFGKRWVCKACGWVHFGRSTICSHCKSDQRKPADNVAFVVDTFGNMTKQWSNSEDRGVKTGAGAPMTHPDGTPWG